MSAPAVRVLPLGGLGEIGKNMTVVESDGRIVVVDVGLRFPSADMLGIDLVLPDISHLLQKDRDVLAIFLNVTWWRRYGLAKRRRCSDSQRCQRK